MPEGAPFSTGKLLFKFLSKYLNHPFMPPGNSAGIYKI